LILRHTSQRGAGESKNLSSGHNNRTWCTDYKIINTVCVNIINKFNRCAETSHNLTCGGNYNLRWRTTSRWIKEMHPPTL
jgi:hypothetical protein